MFDAAEVAFNEIAGLILMPVIRCRQVAVGARWNDRVRAAWAMLCRSSSASKGLSASTAPGFDALRQRCRLRDVMCLTFAQDESGKVAKAFDQCMNLGGQFATRASDRLRVSFWWLQRNADGRTRWCCQEILPQSPHPWPAPQTAGAEPRCPTNARSACTRCSKARIPLADRAMDCPFGHPTALLR